MATITLNYNSHSIRAKKTLDYILSMGFFSAVKTETKRKSGIELALEDVKNGKVYTAKDAQSLVFDCLK